MQTSQIPTKITIPAPPQPEAATSGDWRDAPFTRRHQASSYRAPEIAGTAAERAMFGEDGLDVGDILDVLNPLQHIPFVSTLYRELTGDTISNASKFAGGAVFGGPIGFIASVFDTIFTDETGHSVAGAAIAAVKGEATTQVASATPSKGFSEAEVVESLYPTQSAAGLPKAPVNLSSAQHKIATERYASLAQKHTSERIEILPPQVAAASVTPPAASGSMSAAAQSQAMLELYGSTPAPAHKAYREANMLGYLKAASGTSVASVGGINTVM